jgi:hypothetical protein
MASQVLPGKAGEWLRLKGGGKLARSMARAHPRAQLARLTGRGRPRVRAGEESPQGRVHSMVQRHERGKLMMMVAPKSRWRMGE